MSAAEIAIDIVINNHNYARFLPAAIESARVQSHEKLKVIVVDDGSTDDSRQLLKGYGAGIDVVLKENGGQASTLNAGLRRCAGDVVMLLDADDVLEPDAAAQVATAFAADECAVKVQFRLAVVDADGTPTGAIKPAVYQAMPSGDMRATELALPYDLAWLPTSAIAFRRAALERILPIPEQGYPATGADWYLNHIGALLGPIVSIENVLGSYRVHGANNYERQHAELDLGWLRETIELAQVTSAELLRFAAELGIPHPSQILSIADLANRMVSLRLDPARHPVPSDRATQLLTDSVRAARRRSTAPLPIKLALVAWFAAMIVAPRRLARRLAELFLFPERRSSLNPLLGRLQRRGLSPANTPDRTPE
jgi:cellulose synthase/poly-beta-1,6-N-acetylglucosamine synthase-like glycosyltransferase